jgi:hypothetical protein
MRAVNLIPSEQRGGSGASGRSGGAAWVVVGLVAGLAILAGLYGLARHQISTRSKRAAALTQQARQAEAAAGELAPFTNFIAMREQRQQAVSQLVDARFDWAHAFHEIGRVLPSDASITSLSGTIGSSTASGGPASASSSSSPSSASSSGSSSSSSSSSASSSSTSTTSSGGTSSTSSGNTSNGKSGSSSVTSATPPGSVPTFTLVGCATSQAEVALTLERLRLIDGVSEVSLQSSSTSTTAGGAEGGCPVGDPAFNVVITFDPLPAGSASATTAVSDTTSTGGVR